MTDLQITLLIVSLIASVGTLCYIVYYEPVYRKCLKSILDRQSELKDVTEDRLNEINRSVQVNKTTMYSALSHDCIELLRNRADSYAMEKHSSISVDNADILDELCRIEKEIKKRRKGEAEWVKSKL